MWTLSSDCDMLLWMYVGMHALLCILTAQIGSIMTSLEVWPLNVLVQRRGAYIGILRNGAWGTYIYTNTETPFKVAWLTAFHVSVSPIPNACAQGGLQLGTKSRGSLPLLSLTPSVSGNAATRIWATSILPPSHAWQQQEEHSPDHMHYIPHCVCTT